MSETRGVGSLAKAGIFWAAVVMAGLLWCGLLFGPLARWCCGHSGSAKLPVIPRTTPAEEEAGWLGHPFRVNAFQSFSDFSAADESVVPIRAYLAWDKDAFRIQVEVDTDKKGMTESDSDRNLWTGESVEFFVGAGAEPEEAVHVTVSPGMDPLHPASRSQAAISPAGKGSPIAIPASGRRTASGYAVDCSIPWDALGVATPADGQKYSIQILVNHWQSEKFLHFGWYPGRETSRYLDETMKVVLGEKASPPMDVAGHFSVASASTGTVFCNLAPGVGERVLSVEHEGRVLCRVPVRGDGSRATGSFALPEKWGEEPIRLMDSGRVVAEWRRDAMEHEFQGLINRTDYHVGSSVFSTVKFPNVESAREGLIQRTLGPVRVETKFYDAQYNEVTQADKPGRYGAISHIRFGNGMEQTKFFTLYRTPEKFLWLNALTMSNPVLTTQFGIDPRVLRAQASQFTYALEGEFMEGLLINSRGGVLLAGLSETPPDAPLATHRNNVLARDQNWWEGLRKKLGIDEKYKYVVDLPANYADEPGKSWPLILFLHGMGERGDNPKLMHGGGVGMMKAEKRNLPAIVVAPQCPVTEWWQPQLLAKVLDEVCSKYQVDPDRIYVTGISMGGFGTWDLALNYPDRIAAIVPIAGEGDPRDAAQLAHMPVWAFHGVKDDVIGVHGSIDMVEAIRRAGGHAHVTLYPEGHHGVWGMAYQTDALYQWLFAQKRGQPEVRTPGTPIP